MTSRPSNEKPSKRRSGTLCLVVTTDGTTVYADRTAFNALAEWMRWIAESDPTEHYELHVPWHLTNRGGGKPNVWVLFDDEMRRIFVRRPTGPASGGPFELTFMHATKGDLDRLRARMVSKRVPSAWQEAGKRVESRRASVRRGRQAGTPKR
jgi:hypothetical protein